VVGGKQEKYYSVFTNSLKQGEEYCAKIQQHPVFGKSDFNLIGISQGGILSRYLIQACDLGKHKVHNYLSIGGPQQGVQEVPGCYTGVWCTVLNTIVD